MDGDLRQGSAQEPLAVRLEVGEAAGGEGEKGAVYAPAQKAVKSSLKPTVAGRVEKRNEERNGDGVPVRASEEETSSREKKITVVYFCSLWSP